VTIKCEGSRPKCQNCATKNLECGYEGEVGQSLAAARKMRFEALEDIFNGLQVGSFADAETLFRQIRSSKDLDSVLEMQRAKSEQSAVTTQ
jgi:hypothetical protein